MIEDIIRDNLAVNLGILEPNLKLISKEFHLKNVFGSKGFIDILAKDLYNNYVIIEIKRSKESSRQTIQEVLKYIMLLKQNFNANDSEIRVIIVSTHWQELLSPFSELIYQTSLSVKGIMLHTDLSHSPVKAEIVQPLPQPESTQKFIREYRIDLFKTAGMRKLAIKSLEKKCDDLNIKDYVLVLLNGEKAKNKNVIFPFAIMFAYQELPYNILINILNKTDVLDMVREDFDSQGDYKNYLDEAILSAIHTQGQSDDVESGSPEVFESILSVQNWKIDNIKKYGSYKSDPRNDDESLIRELRGLTGSNEVKFLNFCESTHKIRLKEIFKNSLIPIRENKHWKGHILKVYKHLKTIKEPYRLIVNVFEPVSVLDSILRAFATDDIDYMPIYVIYIDYINENKLSIFHGHLMWSGTPVITINIIQYLMDDSEAMMSRFIDSMLWGENRDRLLHMFNLTYRNYLLTLDSGKQQIDSEIKIEKGIIETISNDSKLVQEWLVSNFKLGSELIKMAQSQIVQL